MFEHYIMDEDGNPILSNLFESDNWASQRDRRRIDITEIDGVVISTVFLTRNQALVEHIAPILFETMIFGWRNHEYHEYYHTIQEAREGHLRAVDLVKASITRR